MLQVQAGDGGAKVLMMRKMGVKPLAVSRHAPGAHFGHPALKMSNLLIQPGNKRVNTVQSDAFCPQADTLMEETDKESRPPLSAHVASY